MKNSLLLLLSLHLSMSLNAQEWQFLSMPDDSTIFHKIAQVDDHLWAIDYGIGRIFKSTDSGDSWKVQYETQGEYLEAIQFLDKQTGYLCGDFGLIMKTEDGGESWHEIGPDYSPRITKSNAMSADTTAIKRYYYQLLFKDENEGMAWGFEVKPGIGWSSSKQFFYNTIDGGKSWDVHYYPRNDRKTIINNFVRDYSYQHRSTFDIYRKNNRYYNLFSSSVVISEDNLHSWKNYSLPQFPDERKMLRSMHFINDHQGYILGGNLEEESTAYIIETLDGGQSWRMLENELAHIHYSVQDDISILLAGKESLLARWTPTEKQDSTFIHSGSTSSILIDGLIEKGEWKGASKTFIKKDIVMYMLQDDEYLYASIQYDTSTYKNFYCDLFIELGKDSLLNLHASQQLGERILTGTEWTDREPAFQWGYTKQWTANQIKFDRSKKQYIPFKAIEFQIAKTKLPKRRSLKVALQTRDMDWEQDLISWPNADMTANSMSWKTYYWR